MNKKLIIIIITIFLLILVVAGSIFLFSNLNKIPEDEEASVELYKILIDKYVTNKIKANDSHEYFFVDDTTLRNVANNEKLSRESINEILSYCKKYDSYKTLEEKSEDSEIMELSFSRTFSISKKTRNTVTMSMKHSIPNVGTLGGYEYTFKYEKGTWTVDGLAKVWSVSIAK